MDDANKLLLEKYGRTIHGKPYFRVARADQKETRKDESGMLHVCEKYNYLHPEAYLLEAIMDASGNPELVTDYSYECLWAFVDPLGEPLPLFWKPIEFIVRCLEDGKHKTLDDYLKADEKKREEFKDWFLGVLENAAMKDPKSEVTGETITVPGNYKKGE